MPEEGLMEVGSVLGPTEFVADEQELSMRTQGIANRIGQLLLDRVVAPSKRLAKAALYALPMVQFAAEDGIFARLYDEVAGGQLLSVGAVVVAGTLWAENYWLSKAVNELPAFQKVQESLEEDSPPSPYRAVRVAKRLGKRALDATKKPFEIVGGAFQKAGERIGETNPVGKILIETGLVNLTGTAPLTLVKKKERDGEKLANSEIRNMATLFTVSWFGLIPGVVALYRTLGEYAPTIQAPLRVCGEAFSTATSFDNNIGRIAMITATGLLWRAGYRTLQAIETKEETDQNLDLGNEVQEEPLGTLNPAPGAA